MIKGSPAPSDNSRNILLYRTGAGVSHMSGAVKTLNCAIAGFDSRTRAFMRRSGRAYVDTYEDTFGQGYTSYACTYAGDQAWHLRGHLRGGLFKMYVEASKGYVYRGFLPLLTF